jgi:tetratricopeptide (TPR) repeat protein
VDGRQVPQFKLLLNDQKLASMVADFPLYLHAIRSAYLPANVRSSLKLPKDADLLVEALMPEVFGGTPLAHWVIREAEVADMARANASGGALVVTIESKNKKEPAIQRAFAPYWLDWQGWSGFAARLVEAPKLPDAKTLHYIAYELGQRSHDAPTGLHTARAKLFSLLDAAADAAAACQDELVLSLDPQNQPSAGAMDALVLMGKLLKSYNELNEAKAALSLALWLNPNHQEANVEILHLLEEEGQIIDVLARLSAMPQRSPAYSTLLTQNAEKLGQKAGALEGKIKEKVKSAKTALFADKPDWIANNRPSTWLYTLGL